MCQLSTTWLIAIVVEVEIPQKEPIVSICDVVVLKPTDEF
jgi:hypothetical protein